MANVFTTAFVINGMLSNSFTSSTRMASAQLAELQKTVTRINARQKQLNTEFTNGAMSVERYDRKMGQLQATLAKTQQQQNLLKDRISQKKLANAKFGEARREFFSTAATIGTLAQPLISVAQTAMKFEFAMSKVGAIANATDSELSLLTQTARTLGEQTKFTATQSAEAMSYLGMAGWKTKEILAGMPGLLSLAAAGNTDLARTADIVSDNLTAFGLGADKAQHMADVYAVTITSTNTNVEMLGETMKYAAPVAHAFGASMEETAAMAGIMANSGVKASNAGTSLRAGLIRLAGPPKMTQKALDQLGLSMEDLTAEQKEAAIALKTLGIEAGNVEGPQKMTHIIGQLQEKMKGLGKEEQLAMAKAIFGQQAAAGWLAVLQAGPEVLGNLAKALVDSDGASEKMAKKMNANAAGAIVRLSSAFESLQISIGNGFLPAIANVGDHLAILVGKMSQLATAHLKIIQGAVYAAGAFSALWVALKIGQLVVAGYNAAVATCVLWQTTLGNCAVALRLKTVLLASAQKSAATVTRLWSGGMILFNAALAACPIGWLILGIAGLVVAGTVLYRHWDTVKQFFTTLWDSPIAKMLFFTTGPVGWIIGAGTALIANWDTVKQWFITLWDNPAQALQQFCDGIKNMLGGALSWVGTKWQAISNFLSTPIFGKVNITAAGKGGEIAQNAYGGIYGRGAFLTTFAENSGESAIPHAPNRRNIGLLAKTNEIMGSPIGGNTINATFAPVINVSGGDGKEVNAILEDKMAEFKRMLSDLQRQERRLSYA